MSEPENTHEIKLYIHCALCMKELPPDQSPETYARFSTGWTPKGLQIWCIRHDCNVMHVDFEGVKHAANTTTRKT